MSAGDYCVKFLSTEKSVRSEAAKSLGKLGKAGAEAVIPLLSADDWVFRYRACEVLGLCGCREFADRLIPMLSDENDMVRCCAAKSLGIIGNPSHVQHIKPLMGDKNPYVVREAHRTLQKWKR